tara:strand:+ start:1935 stop:2195 length:261 start_codon:yes stop_codon:yes gene_type:complete
MKHFDDEVLRLILECLVSYEHSIDSINKKINELQDVSTSNNEILYHVSKNLAPIDESLKTLMLFMEDEFFGELIKNYAHLSPWGQA